MHILLNCDLGESYGSWKIGSDELIMPYIDAANVACGMHAGDPPTIEKTIINAKKYNILIGAHPSYPDLQGFGRRHMSLDDQELESMLTYQLGVIAAFCRKYKITLHHVKPHGALYHDMIKKENILAVFLRVLSIEYPNVKLLYPAMPDCFQVKHLADTFHIQILFEGFADRAYTHNGYLQSRRCKNAVFTHSEQILQQVENIIYHKQVTTVNKTTIPMKCDTICIHSDNPTAIKTLPHIRILLEKFYSL